MPPPEHVLAAFGLGGSTARPLAGGQGRAWSAGHLVFKPADDVAEVAWAGNALSGLVEDGFRINHPLRAGTGEWVVDGWAAWTWLAGEQDTSGRGAEILDVGERLNEALRGLARPAFLDDRTHPWAIADRMAWDEEPMVVAHAALRPVAERLADLVRPEDGPSQVIHGDLAGNVLFAPGLAPGVIDFTPYWRPPRFCSAIVVVDGLLWHGAPPSLLDALAGIHRTSLLARAALYRLIASDRLALQDAAPRSAHLRATVSDHERVAGIIDRSAVPN
jgi:uncharacterized protein (TIGR02569 family)